MVLDLHTVSIQPMQQEQGTGDEGELLPSPLGVATTAKCNIQLLSPAKTLEKYGVELSTMAEVFFEISEAAKFPQGGIIAYEGDQFSIEGDVVIRRGVQISYAMIRAVRLQHV